jgi:hypothetical protein
MELKKLLQKYLPDYEAKIKEVANEKNSTAQYFHVQASRYTS